MKGIFSALLRRFERFLTQGISPTQLALTISFGVVVGAFPVYGTTTILLTIIALMFRLNIVVIQLANFLSLPVMLLTLVPFYEAGACLFGDGSFILKLEHLINLFHGDLRSTLQSLGWAIVHAIAVWAMVAPFAIFILYQALLQPFRAMSAAG